MQPTIGRIVHYRLKTTDVERIASQRRIYPELAAGNLVNEGDAVPALIVRVWHGTLCNLRLILDGPDDLWVTSRPEGDTPGRWTWPPRT
ncbi:hypothetical protein [Streptomyces sp. NRRL F-5135]|uniref:hypothetical protein n=1 Tax=Streptomyces sp. NRRL F-5135 TaxID=1463858 RepID=UPI0004C8BFE0|nr:hypothetical protein [Streptomyces sp. NRRL F-5135]